MTLSLPAHCTSAALGELLEMYEAPEVLQGDDSVACDTCGTLAAVRKQVDSVTCNTYLLTRAGHTEGNTLLSTDDIVPLPVRRKGTIHVHKDMRLTRVEGAGSQAAAARAHPRDAVAGLAQLQAQGHGHPLWLVRAIRTLLHVC